MSVFEFPKPNPDDPSLRLTYVAAYPSVAAAGRRLHYLCLPISREAHEQHDVGAWLVEGISRQQVPGAGQFPGDRRYGDCGEVRG
jgi:hypothetical protein